jgi:general stress protein 26
MKAVKQNDPALQRLADKLEPHGVAMLTLQEPDASLTSRPMTPLEMDGEGALWMMTSRRTVERVLGSRPRLVNLSFARPADGDYVSLSGEADLVDDAARKQALWSPMARPWFDGPQDPDLVLLRVRPRHADAWDGPDTAATRLLAMAASVVAGREIGMGSKEEIDVPRA